MSRFCGDKQTTDGHNWLLRSVHVCMLSNDIMRNVGVTVIACVLYCIFIANSKNLKASKVSFVYKSKVSHTNIICYSTRGLNNQREMLMIAGSKIPEMP